MFTHMARSASSADESARPFLVWVIDHPSGAWIGGRAAYYVVGAKDQWGPMGLEAFAFHRKSVAMAFAREHGGRMLLFGEVTPERIKP